MPSFPFIGGVNPGDLVSGQSQAGSLSGQRNARITDPLISVRGGEVARLTFADGQAIDPFNTWVPAGTTPPVMSGFLTGSGTKIGIGPLPGTDGSMYWKTGSGVDPLDFAGDFSMAFILDPVALDGTNRRFYINANPPADGLSLYASLTGTGYVGYPSAVVATSAAMIPGVPNVFTFGRSGTFTGCKTNLATLNNANTAWVPSFTGVASIGNGVGSNGLRAIIYEMWASTQPYSDILATAIATEVHNKLGITAW